MRVLPLFILALVSCGGDKPAPAGCPAGTLSRDERCEAYGVEACAPGFTADGDGGCAPVLPETDCPEGSIATPGDTRCRVLGVDACAAGFDLNAAGCTPKAPKECMGSERLSVADGACVPVGDCGDTAYPAGTSDAIHVDRAYTGADSDGSETRPYPTVPAALAAVTSTRKTLVVTDGKYELGAKLDKAVEIIGRCPQRVSLFTRTEATPVLSTTAALTLRGLRVTGADVGVRAVGAPLHVLGCVVETVNDGIVVTGKGATLEVSDTSVIGGRGLGITVEGAKATIKRSEIRDTRLSAAGDAGVGIGVRRDGTVDAEALVESTVVSGSSFAGIYVSGAALTLKSSLIRNASMPEKIDGYGVYVNPNGIAAKVTIEQTVIESSKGYGIGVLGSELSLDRTVLRSTRRGPNAKTNYGALIANLDGKTRKPSTLRVTRSLLDDNEETGFIILGSTADISGTIVRNTLGTTPQTGTALAARATGTSVPTVTLRDSLLEHAEDSGITVSAGSLTMERSVIRDVLPDRAGNRFGVGIIAFLPEPTRQPVVTVRSSLIERVHDAGILAFGSRVELDGSVIRNVLQRETGTFGHGVHLSIQPEANVPSDGRITGSRIENTFEAGINVYQSQAVIENTTVLGTSANAALGAFGDGVTVSGIIVPTGTWHEASVTLRRSRIGGSARAAFSVYEAAASAEGLQATCNALDIAIERLPRENSQEPTLEDRGGNACGCGPLLSCRASSANLAPVAAF